MERVLVSIIEICEYGNIQCGDGTCVCTIVERCECGNIKCGDGSFVCVNYSEM
jgi:hypothetical protein